IALPDSMLPVELPEVPDYSPRTFEPGDVTSEPEPPLARNPDWVNVELDLGDGPQMYRRETNTRPNWAGSSWYELRYTDPNNSDKITDPENERYWLGPRKPGDPGGVDLYVGGVEHAVLHLLYARFWHKVLFDLGHISSEEPFHRLINQGYIQAFAYTDDRGSYVQAEKVEEHLDDAGHATYTFEGSPVNREYGKMGKSLKNVVTPDEIYGAFGADTFRVYEMSMGPLEASRPWETRAVVGSQRFLQRVWRLVLDEETGDPRITDDDLDTTTLRVLHKTIDGVHADFDGMRFNTAVAKLIELTNHLTRTGIRARAALEPLVLMLAPLAPHISEELWARLGHDQSLTFHDFPVADPALLVDDTVTCVVQVQGKVRGKLEVRAGIGEDELTALALAESNVVRFIDGREIRKVIVRAPKLVNVVV
ncbi:MAG: class I tRNA ligase family protein, partial [Aeromicrobium sp.]